MSIPQVIFDSDFSTDIGDSHALVLAMAMHKSGLINLLAVIASTSNPKAPGAIDAFLRAFGLTGIPIGVTTQANRDPLGPGLWVGPIYDNFPHDLRIGVPNRTDVDVYQAVLRDAAVASVSVIAIGGATSLEAVRAAAPALVDAKVQELVWAIGDFPSSPSEFNITFDIAAATSCMAGWPTPIIYTGYVAGLAVVAANNVNYELPSTDILAAANLAETTSNPAFQGRPSWDELPLIWALARESAFTLTRGSNAVTGGDGNTFTVNPAGKDAYVSLAWPGCQYASFINPFLVAPRGAGTVSFNKANKYVTFSV